MSRPTLATHRGLQPAYHDIYACLQDTDVVRLKEKYRQAKRRIASLNQRAAALADEATAGRALLQIRRDMHSVAVQTDVEFLALPPSFAAQLVAETRRADSAVRRHEGLRKKYEEQLKDAILRNRDQADTAARNARLEEQVKTAMRNVASLRTEVARLERKKANLATTQKLREQETLAQRLSSEVVLMQADNDRLARENEGLVQRLDAAQSELVTLDRTFFDELEDLKAALNRSSKLNRLYDATLQKLASSLGIPYDQLKPCLLTYADSSASARGPLDPV